VIKKILVALDASPRAPNVLFSVAELARKFDADVYPLRAIFVPPEFPPSAHVEHGDDLPAKMVADAEAELRQLVALQPDLHVMSPIVRNGQPWRVILEVADELEADMIALGSHGYHGIDRLLGTTAAKVVNLARRDVFVVHSRVEPPSSTRLVTPKNDGPYR
jgi:nucleotide-binding universal stress UspA family protein